MASPIDDGPPPEQHQVQDEYKGGGIKLTRPDGTPVWVNARAIAFVREPLEGESGKSTVVFTSGAKQAVNETVEEVIKIIGEDMPGGQ